MGDGKGCHGLQDRYPPPQQQHQRHHEEQMVKAEQDMFDPDAKISPRHIPSTRPGSDPIAILFGRQPGGLHGRPKRGDTQQRVRNRPVQPVEANILPGQWRVAAQGPNDPQRRFIQIAHRGTCLTPFGKCRQSPARQARFEWPFPRHAPFLRARLCQVEIAGAQFIRLRHAGRKDQQKKSQKPTHQGLLIRSR